MRALERPIEDEPDNAAARIEIAGAAGTSAGAIIAALVAAGYKADDLLDQHGKSKLFREVLEMAAATDLFGPRGWAKVAWFRTLTHASGLFPAFTLLGVALVLLVSAIVETVHGNGVLVALLASGIGLVIGLTFAFRMIGGLCETDAFETALNRALAHGKGLEKGSEVSFKQLCERRDAAGEPTSPFPLRIVATNVDNKQLALYSERDTPDLPVAKAVAASIALPVIFQAPRVYHCQHFDGGLVSNLPAWTFDEEMEIDPDAVVVAVEIPDIRSPHPDPGRVQTFLNMARTAIFGAKVLNTRGFTGRLHAVQINPRLRMLDFDAPPQKLAAEVADAARTARRTLTWSLIERPDRIRDICRRVQSAVVAVLMPRMLKGRDAVRVHLSAPDEPGGRGLRILGHMGMERDLDSRLLMPIDSTAPGLTFEVGEALFFKNLNDSRINMSGDRDRFRRSLARQDIAWFLCLPIRIVADGREKTYVITVDSNIGTKRCLVDSLLAKKEDVIAFAAFLADSVRELLEKVEQTPSAGGYSLD